MLMHKLMMKIKSMPIALKVSFAYTICSVLQNCIALITLPLFTRILTVEQYGQSTIYSSWMGIVTIFITLNLPYGSFSKAMIKYENCREQYIASVEGICILLAGIFLFLYIPFCDILNELFELPTFLVICMVLEILGQTAILFWNGKKRFEFKYKEVILVTLIMAILNPILQYVLVMSSEEKGYAKIFGGVLVTIIFGGFFFLYNIIKGRTIFSGDFWKYALNFNVPLVFYYLSQIIFNQSDRIMISHYCGIDKAGIYGVAYSLAIILNFVLNAINNAYVPWFYGKLKERKQQENQDISFMIAVIMAVLLLGIIWLAPEIILIMAGESYHDASWVVPPVAMSVLLLFYAQLFINVEFYYEEKKALVYASIGAAIINIVLNMKFIPIFGYVAAGYTTLICYFVFAIVNYLAMKKILSKNEMPNNAYDIKRLLMVLSFFSIGVIVAMLLYENRAMRYGILFIIGIFLLFNRRRIMHEIKKLLQRCNILVMNVEKS